MQLVTVRPDWLSPSDMHLIHRASKFGQERFSLAQHHEAIHLRFDEYGVQREKLAGQVIDGTRHPVLMDLSRQPLFNMLSCQFHELTHVKQIVKGELEVHEDCIRFRGKYFRKRRDVPEEIRTEEDEWKYYHLPWEIEARRYQEKLMSEFGKMLSLPELTYVATRRI